MKNKSGTGRSIVKSYHQQKSFFLINGDTIDINLRDFEKTKIENIISIATVEANNKYKNKNNLWIKGNILKNLQN